MYKKWSRFYNQAVHHAIRESEREREFPPAREFRESEREFREQVLLMRADTHGFNAILCLKVVDDPAESSHVREQMAGQAYRLARQAAHACRGLTISAPVC